MNGLLAISNSIAQEYFDVFNRKKFDRYISRDTRLLFIENIIVNGVLVEVKEPINVCRDPKDNKFIETAVEGNALCIVTGDLDLLELHPFRRILILNPSDFLKRF